MEPVKTTWCICPFQAGKTTQSEARLDSENRRPESWARKVSLGARTETCEENQRIKFRLKDRDQDGQPSCWTVHWAAKGGENNSKEIIECPERCLKVPGRPQPPSYQVGLKLHSQSSLEANVISTHGEETGRHSREIRTVGDLVMWDGPLGKIVGGIHPELFEELTMSVHMTKTDFARSMRTWR